MSELNHDIWMSAFLWGCATGWWCAGLFVGIAWVVKLVKDRRAPASEGEQK